MSADRNLLFGLLALQNGLIGQDQLLAAFRDWTRAKDRPLADHLLARGDLDEEQCLALDAIVGLHLKKYGDAEQSLAAIPAGVSTRSKLEEIGDSDIAATLLHVGSASADPGLDQTVSYAVGSAAEDGHRFRLLRPHARGGLGAVYVALDSELNREVALKQIHDQHADDPRSRQRFLLEAEVTGGLEHPGIVPVYGLGSYGNGRPYYAMRFVRGDSLKDAISAFHADTSLRADRGRRSLELRKLLRRFLDVCNAIDYAHSRGVLHRDIKPGNIIVGRHGETLVVDWGLAKAQGRADTIDATDERPLRPSSASGTAETLPGAAIGTPGYMSPEQARGDLDALGPQSDVYALGATLYCTLTGRAPIEGPDIASMLRAAARGDFPPPRKIDPTIDRGLEATCLKAMASNPADRYPTARALADDIDRWLADERVSAYAEPWTRTLSRWLARHRTGVAVAGSLLVLATTGLEAGNLLLGRANRAIEEQRRIAVDNGNRAAANAERAERNYQIAREAIDRALNRIGRERLENEPGLERLRADLFAAPLEFYERFVAERGDDPASRVDLATSLGQLGGIKFQTGRAAEAVTELRRANAVMSEAVGPSSAYETRLQSVGLQVSLAEFEGQAGEIDTSIASFHEALVRCGDLRRERPDDVAALSLDLEARQKLGILLLNTKRLDEAIAVAREGLALEETHRARTPGAPPLDERAAELRGILGMAADRQERFADAATDHEAEVATYRPLVDRDPSNRRRRVALATALNNRAMALRKIGRGEESVRVFEESLEIMRALVRDFPAYPSLRIDAARTAGNLSFQVADMGNPARGEALNREALTMVEAAVAAAPGVPAYIKILAGNQGNFGNRALNRKDYAEAVARFDRSLVTLEALETKLPDDTATRLFLRNSYWGRADALEALGRRQEALVDYAKAIANATPAPRIEITADQALCRARMGDVDGARRDLELLLANPNLADYDVRAILEALNACVVASGDTSHLLPAPVLLRSAAGGKLLLQSNWREAFLNAPEWSTLRGIPGVLPLLLDAGFPARGFTSQATGGSSR